MRGPVTPLPDRGRPQGPLRGGPKTLDPPGAAWEGPEVTSPKPQFGHRPPGGSPTSHPHPIRQASNKQGEGGPPPPPPPLPLPRPPPPPPPPPIPVLPPPQEFDEYFADDEEEDD
ncbi:unnamed protein product [Leuciscus chuanchicus]